MATYAGGMSQSPGYPPEPRGPQGTPQFQPPGNGPVSRPYPPQSSYQPQPYQPQPSYQARPYPPQPYVGQQPFAPQLQPGPVRPQRPAVIAMAATMTVTASLQWICALSLGWLVATAGASGLSTTDTEGSLYHILRRFHLRMVEGLAFPLYGFATVAFFLGFVILAPRVWARLALTVTGVAALAWSGWWLRNDILWWLPIATYIGIVCLIVWTPGATQWYRRRGL